MAQLLGTPLCRRLFAIVFTLSALSTSIACGPTAPSPPDTTPPPPSPPTVTAVNPAIGTSDGGVVIRIEGTRFQRDALVRLGGIVVSAIYGNGSLFILTPPHAPGVVDVEVTIGDQTGVLANAFTFVAPDTLDFNGSWAGYIGESDLAVRFTIEANVVTAVACGGVSLELSTPATVSNGRFSFTGPGGSITGRILTPTDSTGEVTMASCVDPNGKFWWALK